MIPFKEQSWVTDGHDWENPPPATILEKLPTNLLLLYRANKLVAFWIGRG